MNPTEPKPGDVSRFESSAESIRESAVDWISRRETGLGPADDAEFQAWLMSDPRHRPALRALQPVWTEINRPRRSGRGAGLRLQVAGAVRRRWRNAVAVSSFSAAAVIALGLFFFSPQRPVERGVPRIVQRVDQQTLPDGSTIELNLGAEVEVEFAPARRGVRLVRGEALFHVATDPSRPFVVTAGSVAVRAVGTAFAVRVERSAVDVLVTEGQVAVNRSSAEEPATNASVAAAPASIGSSPALQPVASPPEVVVAAGQRVSVPTDALPKQALAARAVSTRDVATALEWRNRRVEFNGTSLAEAVELFNRDNPLQLALADSDTGALRISGVFWTSDPEAFSRALETSFGLSVNRTAADRILLGR